MKCKCDECLVFQIKRGQAQAWKCVKCKNESFYWHQDEKGYFYLECTSCGEIVAADLNTPCEEDSDFDRKQKITIKSQRLSNETIIELCKITHINAVEIYNYIKNGIGFEMDYLDYFRLIELLKKYNIEYVDDDLKLIERYSLYKECNYPHSRMKYYK